MWEKGKPDVIDLFRSCCHFKKPHKINAIFPMVMFVLFSFELSGKTSAATNHLGNGILGDPFNLLFFLIGIAVVPFIAVMTTSFAKIVVVLSIARQAIGTAQTPPNIVIMSLAIMLTCFSMYPVAQEIYQSIDMTTISSKKGSSAFFDFTQSAKEPIRKHLSRHAKAEDQALFFNLMKGNDSKSSANISLNDFIILTPAFLISELTLAFQIGFLVYLPFLVIEMTVANLLMALGMQMLAPTTVSLPFKILLFVLVDGWRLLSEGLAKG